MKLKKKWKILIGIGIISLPLVISILCWLVDSLPQVPFFKIGSNSDWIAFWGSVSGSILGVFGTYLVLRIQLENDKEQYEEAQKRYEDTQVDNTFFNMIELFQNIQSKLEIGRCTKIIVDIKNAKDYYIKNKKETERSEVYEKNYDLIKQGAETLERDVALKGTEASSFIELMLRNAINTEAKINNFTAAYHEMIKTNDFVRPFSKEGQKSIDELDQLSKEFTEIDNKYKKFNLREEEIFKIVNDIFSFNHSKVGAFLRMFHRIVKYIMDSRLSAKKKKEYLGMLRALLSSDEILVIFYNTFYTNRGKGLKKQLQIRLEDNGKEEYTEFFADKTEIKKCFEAKGKIDLPFFKLRDLIFPELDLMKIMSLTDYK